MYLSMFFLFLSLSPFFDHNDKKNTALTLNVLRPSSTIIPWDDSQ